MTTISAYEILSLLKTKHVKDVFIPECGTGSSFDSAYGRLDAWAMKKAYSRAMTWGYEIKVNRRDFIQDEKWRKYLGVCSSFYFVCPWGLIDKSEVPEEAGLIYMTSTKTRLTTKKKAPARKVDIPPDFWRSILMNRCQISGPQLNEFTREQNITYWENWLRGRDASKSLGYRVSGAIRERVDKVRDENHRLENEIEALTSVKKRLVEMGFDIETPGWRWAIERKVANLFQAVPHDLEMTLSSALKSLGALRGALDGLKLEKTGVNAG